jgi:cell division protein FtsQ
LQQVAADAFANARAIPHAVDERQLPVPGQSRVPRTFSRQALIRVSHAWVLHRRLLLQMAGGLLALLAIVGAYQLREPLEKAGATVFRMVQGEFAAAGFGIDAIKISGQTLSDDRHIIALMMMSGGSSTLNFDAQKARNLLRWMRAVDTATVRKVYPGEIIVDIVEKTPAVRWRVGPTTWLVDNDGKKIGVDGGGAYSDLPLVVGEGAADDSITMTKMMDRHPLLQKDLAVLSRIGDRRWDLIYYSGLRVQLPEQGVAQALDNLQMYQTDYALLDRDVTLIDMRVPGMMVLKPGELSREQLDAEAKQAKKKKPTHQVDPAYETPAEVQAEKKPQ